MFGIPIFNQMHYKVTLSVLLAPFNLWPFGNKFWITLYTHFEPKDIKPVVNLDLPYCPLV